MRSIIYYLFTGLLLVPQVSSALPGEDDLMMYGDEEFVSIATGRKQLISQAPAVVSVVTAEDIKKAGVKDINGALEMVAGLHVSNKTTAYNPLFLIRGIHSNTNSQILMMVNGLPITNVFLGDRSQAWGGMPVEAVSRIEVIRGPGSAIYGADAFSGTINIITKTANEIDGVEVGASTGSFDTHRVWGLYGGIRNGWETALTVEMMSTNGQSETISSDRQTVFDGLFGTSASLAPGEVNTENKSIDLRLDLAKDNWRFRAGYQGRRDVGLGAGANQAIDPFGGADSDRVNFDLTYQDKDFSDNLEVKGTFSYFYSDLDSELFLLPAGVDFPGLNNDFPNGLIGGPETREQHFRFDTSAFYTGIVDHDIRIGAGVHYVDLYETEDYKNFEFVGGAPFPVFLGSVMRTAEADKFAPEKSRTVKYVFVQDDWSMIQDWSLVTGIRYDDYSDFGGTLNPRLALVWDASNNLTSKLLVGRAFRAPSFAESFNKNNPIAIGNSELDPEVIETYELAFDYRYSGNIRANLNLFCYKMEDIIRFTPVAENSGDQKGRGFEAELTWNISPASSMMANFAYQQSTDQEDDDHAGHAPMRQLYVRADHKVTPDWDFNAQLNYVMDRKRIAGDPRADIDDYATLDLTLRRKNLFGGFEAAITVNNLTDEDVREPSLFNPRDGFVSIPDDLPMAGRSITAEIRRYW